LAHSVQESTEGIGAGLKKRAANRKQRLLRSFSLIILPLALAVAGCGGGVSSGTSKSGLTISPGAASIDTNCTGCNATDSSGNPVEQFTAKISGTTAAVNWTLSPSSGAGSISSSGQYTPPGYLTSDTQTVTVTATVTANTSQKASTTLTITPGFLQPLSPENVALGANGTVKVIGTIAEAGGTTGIKYAVSSTSTGSSGGQGTVGAPVCARSANTFTTCTVTYTAPSSVSSAAATYIVGTVGTSSSKDSTEVLLNSAGVNSDPASHETPQTAPIVLGSSGGNNADYDTSSNSISDCCGGTLGAMVKDASGNQYILSNNHVLARSDQATKGETIIQPGLVDGSCKPYGNGGSELPVGTLTGWLALSSKSTNADAAIAKVDTGMVNPNGAIQELGALQSDGTLASAPPGVSSSGGKGEAPAVNMTVAKSGRTTGLTCGSISAIDASVQVSYYKDCGETQSYLTKSYTNQVEITGNQFSDAGDSGSLVVDTSNGEPVGLFFAGGVDNSGNTQAIASPAPDVLNELNSQLGGTYTFVGTTDHPVSCLNYGAGAVSAAQARTLSGAQIARAETALSTARQLVNPSLGVLGVATGKSSDEPGAAAVLVYVSANSTAKVPATMDGIRTVVIPTTSGAVATGSAPLSPFAAGAAPALPSATLRQAIATKESVAANLMQQNPAFFGVAVGQSYDDPREAALVIYVDRDQVPATLPATIGGLRTRYIVMNRLHVTRAYASPIPMRSRCMLQSSRPATPADFNLQELTVPRPLPLQY
jgi:hypothetical protein